MIKYIVILIFSMIFLTACGIWAKSIQSNGDNKKINTENLENAYFAWGCFWCMEPLLESQPWVEWVYSGYTWGTEETATYELTSAKDTDHREAIKVVYDPDIISYSDVVELFWTQIDPTDDGGQFNDRGFVYSTAIYYSNDAEKIIAQQSKNTLEVSKRFDAPIVTSIEEAKPFYLAEEYHQDYYKKNPIRYNAYALGSGRKWFIKDNWQDRIDELTKPLLQGEGKATIKNNGKNMEDLKTRLTPMQYKVTQEEGTEPPFQNEYWDNKEDGIYVDIVDGTPLYSSTHKFDSGTGWPSFTQAIDDNNISEHVDTRYFMTRTEVRSEKADSHLGHIFPDAPKELGGIRHCINSAALRFIPLDEMEDEGYGEYLKLFEEA